MHRTTITSIFVSLVFLTVGCSDPSPDYPALNPDAIVTDRSAIPELNPAIPALNPDAIVTDRSAIPTLNPDVIVTDRSAIPELNPDAIVTDRSAIPALNPDAIVTDGSANPAQSSDLPACVTEEMQRRYDTIRHAIELGARLGNGVSWRDLLPAGFNETKVTNYTISINSEYRTP